MQLAHLENIQLSSLLSYFTPILLLLYVLPLLQRIKCILQCFILELFIPPFTHYQDESLPLKADIPQQSFVKMLFPILLPVENFTWKHTEPFPLFSLKSLSKLFLLQCIKTLRHYAALCNVNAAFHSILCGNILFVNFHFFPFFLRTMR